MIRIIICLCVLFLYIRMCVCMRVYVCVRAQTCGRHRVSHHGVRAGARVTCVCVCVCVCVCDVRVCVCGVCGVCGVFIYIYISVLGVESSDDKTVKRECLSVPTFMNLSSVF